MIKLTEEERKAARKVSNKAYYEKSAEANKPKKSAYMVKYYSENREKILANGVGRKRWKVANKDKIKKANARWYLLNKESASATRAKYNKNNKAKVNVTTANYRARKFGATIYMTKEDKANIDELYTIAENATKLFGYSWAVDHIVPLNKGGLHKLTNLQVVPAKWNSTKGDRNSDLYWG